MKGKKAAVLTFVEKGKNILASNSQGHLNTIKADAEERLSLQQKALEESYYLKRKLSKCSYTVSGVLSSSDLSCTSRSESLKELLEGDEKYVVYKFNLRVRLEGHITFLLYVMLDAYMLSIDRKGFDVLGKVPSPLLKDGSSQYQWKEFRFTLREEASDVENFCHQHVEMEEEAVKKISVRVGASPNSPKPISAPSIVGDSSGDVVESGFKLPPLALYSDVFGDLVKLSNVESFKNFFHVAINVLVYKVKMTNPSSLKSFL
ncbi:hypothetical protein SO802_004012 [Lithocarpus litseifolius]|uniref:Uncharacterized protein n=1 Tax=Lithocarpus litseifolius TaxID=425828 RepID=A0AAW2E5M6_9ROSI